MRTAPSISVIALLSLSACGGDKTGGQSPTAQQQSPAGFDPPAPPEGFTRLVSKTVKGVQPGADVTFCQYVMPPFDHDVDVLHVQGYQSKGGHHAVAFSYTPGAGEQPGTSFPCMGTEFSSGVPDGGAPAGGLTRMGTFLGGVGGEGGGKPSTSLPEGVAFRLKAGSGIMLNVHYLNSTDTALDGDAVVDLEFADPDPNRKIAALFINLNLGFELAPAARTTSTIDCVAGSDVQILMMANHMHDYGTSATTSLTPAGSTQVQTLHEDKTWSFDMQFNPAYSTWPVDAPLVIHTGDTLSTTCNWDNNSAIAVKFPREMCLGVGFALTSGDKPSAPVCVKGTWLQP